MIKRLNLRYRIFYFISFLLIFILPKGSTNYFNGLPWTSTFEIIFICSILPFFIFNQSLFNEKKIINTILIFLNILSLVLFFSPKFGISHNQFFEDQKNSDYIKTYSTIWNKNYSSIQKKNWYNKKNFPIDWTARHPLNLDEKNNFKYFKNYNEFINLNLNYVSNFSLVLNENSNIIFKIIGSDKLNSKFKYRKINSDNDIYFNIDKVLRLDKGIYNFKFDTFFKNKNWKFEVYVEKENKLFSAFEKRLVFYEVDNLKIEKINKFKYLGFIFDYLTISFVFFIFLTFIFEAKLILKFLILSAGFIVLVSLFNKINSIYNFDQVGSSLLSIFLLVLSFYLFFKKNLKNFNIEKTFILISIFVIGFYSYKFFNNIDNLIWFSNGDDWEIFQVLGRLIAVDNVWVLEEEKITIRRYGIRIVVALLHIIFGKTFFPQQLYEVWAIILSSYFLCKILIHLNFGRKISLIFGCVLMMFFFGDNLRWLIGRGLTEFYSLFLICFLAYLFINISRSNNSNTSSFLLCCFIGFLIVVFREDQIFISLSLISFYFYSFKDKNLFSTLINIIKKNLNIILIYFSFVLLGLFFIFSKNYISFGDVSISQDALHFKFEKFKEMIFPNYIIEQSPLQEYDKNNVFVYIDTIHYLDDFYRFFTGSDPYNFPRPISFILVSGFIASLYFVIKIRKFNNINLGIFIVTLSHIFIPTLLFTHAYNPRYIISYLPFALMSLMFFIKIFRFRNINFLKYYLLKK